MVYGHKLVSLPLDPAHTIVYSLGAGAGFLEKLENSLWLVNIVVGDMGKCTVPHNNSQYTVNTDIHS